MIKDSKGSVWKRKISSMDQNKNQEACLAAALPEQEINTNSDTKKKMDRNGGKKHRILSFHELPNYMKDNEFILDYYRAEWPAEEALFSLFRWHNETLNVWTHLLGCLLFVGLTVGNVMDVPRVADFITMMTGQFPSSAEANASKNFPLGTTNLLYLNQEPTPKISPETRWPFYVFLSGSIFCLLSSTVCHLFSCHSHAVNSHLLHLDYVGIAVMIIASFFPPIYYVFHCTPHWQIIYLTGITFMGACTIIALLSRSLSARKYRSLRAGLFVSMGLFGLFPAVHALVLNWDDPQRDVILAYESAMAAAYLAGTLVYIGRIPERWRPGWFDLAGHSHQIFHVFVVLGALAHYGAARVFLSYGEKGCGLFA